VSETVIRRSEGGTPVLGFAAFSGTGKTTLLTRVLPVLRERGLRVGLVKHAHHRFDIDHEGKDSYALRKAGATPVLVSSRERWALVCENETNDEPGVAELIERIDGLGVDLILVEGFKTEALPKIELVRPSLKRPLLHHNDPNIIAIASDAGVPPEASDNLPLLDLNDPSNVADFIQSYAGQPDK